MSNFGDAFPAITCQKMGLMITSKMLNSCKQQTMLVPRKTPPFPKATPQVQGRADRKRYQNAQGRVLWPMGLGACLQQGWSQSRRVHGKQGMLPSSGKDKRAIMEVQALFRLTLGSLQAEGKELLMLEHKSRETVECYK